MREFILMCSHSQAANLIFTMIDYFILFEMLNYSKLVEYFFHLPLVILLK